MKNPFAKWLSLFGLSLFLTTGLAAEDLKGTFALNGTSDEALELVIKGNLVTGNYLSQTQTMGGKTLKNSKPLTKGKVVTQDNRSLVIEFSLGDKVYRGWFDFNRQFVAGSAEGNPELQNNFGWYAVLKK